jgi:PKD repeat protein
MVRETGGALRVLVDGANPTSASLYLIDVNAPDVSYDGQKIVFAGFSSKHFDAVKDTQPLQNPNNWRLYVINADGSGLRQLTFPDQDDLDYSQFGPTASGALKGHDDTDPAWLPDGRIVFASTRWPAFGQYSAARTTNLYVVYSDGSGLHRITSERNGAERPVVDPVTGRILFSRWWRNQRFAINDMATIRSYTFPCCDGYEQKDGLTRSRHGQLGGPDFLFRNSWHLATINPDGTSLAQFAGPHHQSDGVHAYGGSFAADGTFVANYFPMTNMTEAAGFGGLRRYRRGAPSYEPIIGITARYGYGMERVSENPPSYGVLKGAYAGEPVGLQDGRIVTSWAEGIDQDYGLSVIDADGGNRTTLFDQVGTTELRAKVLASRPVPPIISDSVSPGASLLPPTESGPYDIDGTFVFNALNVYGNGPVDSIEASAPRLGSAKKIRFFADFQRVNWGSLETLDWPVLLGEREIHPDGSVIEPNAPANIPLFEQIRSADGTVPFTLGKPAGAAHVAGMNYGKPGSTVRCIGCHSGHTMIPVPQSDEEAKWSNLAPSADILYSSSGGPWFDGIINRKVRTGDIWDTWYSATDNVRSQWIELVFPEPVAVRTVRLYNVRFTDGSTLQVHNATVRLGSLNSSDWVASASAGELSISGTEVSFPEVAAQRVRVEIDSVTGVNYSGLNVAGLAEIEVIARAGDFAPSGNRPPIAHIAQSPSSGAAPLTVVFDGSESTDADGSIASYSWSFGDGATATGKTVEHTFTSAGSYTVRLSVTDDQAASAATTATITAQGEPSPEGHVTVASFALIDSNTDQPISGLESLQANATLNLLNLPANISLRANVVDEVASVAFDINGQPIRVENVAPYALAGDINGDYQPWNPTPGTYTVAATPFSEFNASGSPGVPLSLVLKFISAAENRAPSALIEASATSGLSPLVVLFDANDSSDPDGKIVSYSWSFGDGTSASGVAVSHTFVSVGSFVVGLVVTDDEGAQSSKNVLITVTEPPAPNESPAVSIDSPASGTSVQHGARVEFRASATDPEDGDLSGNLTWSSSLDGVFGSGGAPSIVTLRLGSHVVTASVGDTDGATASDSIILDVQAPPEPEVTVGVASVDVTLSSLGRNWGWRGRASVRLTTNEGVSAGPNFLIEGSWLVNGLTRASGSAATNADGLALLQSPRLRLASGSQVSFVVTRITHDAAIWDGVQASGSAVVP